MSFFGAEQTSRFNQFLNRRLILACCLEQIDADRRADWNERVRRIAVELLESGDHFEPSDLARRRRLFLSARSERLALTVRTGRHVDLAESFFVALRVTDRPEEFFRAGEAHPLFAVRRRRDLGSAVRGRSNHGCKEQSKRKAEFSHE